MKVAIGGAFALVLFIVLLNVYVLTSGGESTSEVAEVPVAEVAIVPGALVEPDGDMSSMLAARVEQASRLWHAGKVEKILVSGDHGAWKYDEPDTMRKALVGGGVAPEDVFEDHAGFDTWATMVRAREIFGVRDAVVVTQGFHMPRALFLADEAGIDATGLTADLQEWGSQGKKSSALAGEGGRRRHPRDARDGRAPDSHRHRGRPRKLGPGPTGRHSTGGLARPLITCRFCCLWGHKSDTHLATGRQRLGIEA
jgi:SanA protein